jgi:hypothetical protein
MANPDSERRQERPKKRRVHNVENDLMYTGVRRWILMGSTMMAGRGGKEWAAAIFREAPTRTIIPRSEGDNDTLSHKVPV